MYRFEILTEAEKIIDGSYVSKRAFVNIDNSDIKINIKSENYKAINTINGNVVVTSEDFDVLEYFSLDYVSSLAYLIVYEDGENITGYDLSAYVKDDKIIQLELTDIDFFLKEAKFTIKSDTIFGIYSRIFNNYDEEYNIKDVAATTLTYTSFKGTSYITETGSTGTIGFKDVEDATYIIADIDNYLDTKQQYASLNNMTLKQVDFTYNTSDCTNDTIILDTTLYYYFQYALVPENTSYLPAGKNWKYYDIVTVGTTDYKRFIKPLNITDKVIGSAVKGDGCAGSDLYYYDNITYNIESVDGTRDFIFRKTSDVLEYLFYYADSNVLFDTDSYSDYLPDYIAGITDIFTDYYGNVRSYHQTVLNLRLKEMLEWFEKYGFIWYLQEISGSIYFRIKTEFEITVGSNNTIDLKDYYGNDFRYLAKQYKSEPIARGIIRSDILGNNIGWNGDIPISQVGEDYSITDNNYFTNIDYIFDVQDEQFTNEDGDMFVFANVDAGTTDISQTATIGWSTYEVNNYDLSYEYLVYTILNKLPVRDLFGYSTLAEKERLQKRRSLEFEIPINKMSDIDFGSYIEIDGRNYQVKSLEIPTNKTFAKLIVETY